MVIDLLIYVSFCFLKIHKKKISWNILITSWCFKTTLKKWLNQICFWRFMRSRSHYLSSCQRAIHQTRSQWVNPSHCNINKVSCTPTVWCFAQQRFSNLHQLFEKSSHKLAVQSQDFRYHVREMIIGSLNTFFFVFSIAFIDLLCWIYIYLWF